MLLQLLQTVAGTTQLYDGRILLNDGISEMLIFDDHRRRSVPDFETDGPRTKHPSRCGDGFPVAVVRQPDSIGSAAIQRALLESVNPIR